MLTTQANAKDSTIDVEIADPYIDIRTGPGRGYPIFHVEERGSHIQIIKRRTQWYKVRKHIAGNRYKEGWVSAEQLEKTLDTEGKEIEFKQEDRNDYVERSWEAGSLVGDFSGAQLLSLYGGYLFTRNISTELTIAQALGKFSDSILGTISVVHQPFPDWRISPFIAIGTGKIRTKPKATLVQSEDRTDSLMVLGIGFKSYILQRFFVRVEYKNHLILTDTDENEEVESIQLGFSVFF